MAPRKTTNTISPDDQQSLIALRYYELEAYSAVVTALRAEGGLSEIKKNILKQLQELFSISNERHKAEIRRVANDDNLASIAKQVQGFPCDDDWQNEGKRLFKVLHHSVPITAYTKLADEIAESLTQEKQLSHKSRNGSISKNTKEISVSPAQDPQKISSKDALDEIQKLVKDCKESPPASHSDKSTIDQDPFDSLVYLPSGIVVEVDPKSNTPKRVIHNISNDKNLGTSDSKLPVFTSNICTFNSLQNNQEPSKTDFVKNLKPADVEKMQSMQPSPNTIPVSSFKQSPENSFSRKPSTDFDPYVHQMEFDIQTKNPVNSGKRSRSLSQSIDGAWATKHNAASDAKRKRKLQKSSESSNSKKLSKSLQEGSWNFSPAIDKKAKLSSQSTTQPRNRISPSQRAKAAAKNSTRPKAPSKSQSSYRDMLYFSPPRMAHDIDSVQPKSDNSPQKIFRPSMQLSSPTKDEAFSQNEIGRSSHLVTSYPVEAGLAPVSSIVSQVGSYPGLEISSSSRTNLQANASRPSRPLSTKLESHPNSTIVSLNSSATIDLTSTSSGSYTFHSHPHKPRDVAMQPTSSTSKTIEFEYSRMQVSSSSNLMPPSYLPLVKPSIQISATCKVLKDSNSAAGNRLTSKSSNLSLSTPSDQSPATSSSTSINLSIPVSIPRLVTTSTSTTSLITTINKPVSTTSIIKVTPRTLTGPKGSPIVTQIPGTRINKPFSSLPGSVKPSIIVVRQTGKKSISPAPTKLLDIDGSGKNVARIKSVTPGGGPVVKTATIIRPINTKVSTSVVTTVSRDVTSQPALQKVVSKGKMRQLVLKPTSSSLLRQSSKDHSSSLLSVTSTPGTVNEAEVGSSNIFERPLQVVSAKKTFNTSTYKK